MVATKGHRQYKRIDFAIEFMQDEGHEKEVHWDSWVRRVDTLVMVLKLCTQKTTINRIVHHRSSIIKIKK